MPRFIGVIVAAVVGTLATSAAASDLVVDITLPEHQTAAYRPDAYAGVRLLLVGGDVVEPAAVRAVMTASALPRDPSSQTSSPQGPVR